MVHQNFALPILQLKISLKHAQPPIWRRVQIPASATFLDLHAAIQDSFGWEDCHLHHFIFGKRHEEPVFVGPRSEDDWIDMMPESERFVRNWLKNEGDKCEYEYDFGDGWEHTVLLEKILPTTRSAIYPRCIAGKRACPPEDSGGMYGYIQKLEVLAHPKSKYYKEVREWMGDFDPEHFNLEEIIFQDIERHAVEKWAAEK